MAFVLAVPFMAVLAMYCIGFWSNFSAQSVEQK
jgi:hypothetical protein